MAELTKSQFRTMLNLDVSEELDKDYKGLSYLSWSSAYQLMMEQDPMASYDVLTAEDGIPLFSRGEIHFVKTSVTMFGVTKYMWLPVMDNKHNSVANPNARQISDNIMRCLVKNIAMFGIGLRVFKGENYEDLTLTDLQKNQIAKLMNDLSISREEISDICHELFEKDGVRLLYKDEANDLISHLKTLRRSSKTEVVKEEVVKSEQPDEIKEEPAEEMKAESKEEPKKRRATTKAKATPKEDDVKEEVKEEPKEEPKEETDTEETSTEPMKKEQYERMSALISEKKLTREAFAKTVKSIAPHAKSPKQLTSEEADAVIAELENL